MKDKKARKRIDNLEKVVDEKPFRDLIDRGEGVIHNLWGVVIKDCPKCNHPVLAIHHKQNLMGHWLHPEIHDAGDYYQCLTCGSKFTCTNKRVCELVKE